MIEKFVWLERGMGLLQIIGAKREDFLWVSLISGGLFYCPYRECDHGLREDTGAGFGFLFYFGNIP